MIEARERPTGQERIMVLAPHPDDESIATGGVLLRAASAHAPVRVLYMTDGENNPWAQRVTEGIWRITAVDRCRWGARRRREALEALACLGIPPGAVRFLGLADQRLTDLLVDAEGEAVRRLVGEIAAWRPTELFVPSLLDRHPDHSATAILAQIALAQSGREARPKVLTYTVHAPVAWRGERTVRLQVLSRSERDAKEQAILCHASQLRLRHRFLLHFVEEPERFELGHPTTIASDATHPLRLVRASCGEWSFALRGSFRLAIDRATLLLISLGDDQMSSLSLPIPRLDGRSPLTDSSTGDNIGEVTTRWSKSRQVVTIASSRLRNVDLRLAKLELQWNRRLGVFDRWPWLSFGLPTRGPARARLESAERVGQYTGA